MEIITKYIDNNKRVIPSSCLVLENWALYW